MSELLYRGLIDTIRLVDCQSKKKTKKLTDWLTKINLQPNQQPPPPPHRLTHSGPANLNAGLSLTIQRDSLFLITNEGVFSKWIGVGGIGGNWSIIWRIRISSVHLLPFCFVTHAGLFRRRRKTQKFDCFPLYAEPLLFVFAFSREKKKKLQSAECDWKKKKWRYMS